MNEVEEKTIVSEEMISSRLEKLKINIRNRMNKGYISNNQGYEIMEEVDEALEGLELPVIEEIISKRIKSYASQGYSIGDIFKEVISGEKILMGGNDALETDEQTKQIDKWILNNQELFSRAYLFDYKIKETIYYVILDERHALYKIKEKIIDIVEEDRDKLKFDNGFQLTEKEIRDYDERYLAFKISEKDYLKKY